MPATIGNRPHAMGSATKTRKQTKPTETGNTQQGDMQHSNKKKATTKLTQTTNNFACNYLRKLRARGTVKAVPLNCSAYNPYGHCWGLLPTFGRASLRASKITFRRVITHFRSPFDGTDGRKPFDYFCTTFGSFTSLVLAYSKHSPVFAVSFLWCKKVIETVK